MMTANVAKEMTERAVQHEIETRRQRAEEICNGLDDSITHACLERKSEITVEVPREVFSYVVNICKEAGYTTTLLNNTTFQLIW